jgi:hypothetical protein
MEPKADVYPGYVPETEIAISILGWMKKNLPQVQWLTIEESARDVIKVLHNLSIEDSGEFFNHDGSQLPW